MLNKPLDSPYKVHPILYEKEKKKTKNETFETLSPTRSRSSNSMLKCIKCSLTSENLVEWQK